ncbi:MAG: thioredoxin family protein, partial [Cyanobacteria bacterium]|nr:thioredoxin family protein [Cyanobacteriota bacterium]
GKDKVLVAANEESITWHDKYDETLKAAEKDRKWVLVDVFTEWCGWCKKLDHDVYEKASVAKFINQSFVCMKADAEKGDGKTVAEKFGIHGYPCTLILDPKGREKGRVDGYMDATAFPKKLSQILKGK